LKAIKEFSEILASEPRILGIIKSETEDIIAKFGDARKTEITDMEAEVEIEDLIEKGNVVVTVTHSGYIKRLPVDTYKAQNRGGKGIIAAETNEGDFIEHLFVADTHSYILFFTSKGQVHWLKVYQVPEASRQSKGKAIVNLVETSQNEKITAMIPVKDFDDKHFLIMATKEGIVKKTSLDQFSNPRKGGIRAITLAENDVLENVVLTDGKQSILLLSEKGMAVKFSEEDVRPSGRTSQGVIGIRLHDGDCVVDMEIAEDSKTLLTMTENGYGKRTLISEYRLINRGGSGVINIQCTERNGKVATARTVDDNDEIMLISKNGIIIRVPATDISVIGRNTQGVRVMKLEANDMVMAAAKIARENGNGGIKEYAEMLK
jgi:DNA gyrase subunit A